MVDKTHPRYVCLDEQTFGSLTVIKDLSKGRILCSCVCGAVVSKNKVSVKSGRTSSCGKGGCHKGVKDLSGKRFGYLTVTKLLETKKTHRYGTLWECMCDCGNTCEIVSHSLVSGYTRSCGCKSGFIYSEKTTKPNFEAIKNALYDSYRRHADKLGIEFNLTLDIFVEMLGESCHYCGREPSNTRKLRSLCGPTEFRYNGVDRMDSKDNYSENNCVPCCSKCNYAKRKLSYTEFIQLVKDIAARH